MYEHVCKKIYIYINVFVNAYVFSFQLITSMHMYIVLHVYEFQFIQCTTLLTIIHSLECPLKGMHSLGMK